VSSCYGDLKVWQEAMEMVIEVYRISRNFPRDEQFGLTAQLRRSAVSVPSNIAEGKGRFSRKETVQFLLHARGSLMELETQLKIASRSDYLPQAEYTRLERRNSTVAKMLNGLINRFQTAA
jgi:four helix bundle protein